MENIIMQCPICERQYLLVPDFFVEVICKCGHVLCSFAMPRHPTFNAGDSAMSEQAQVPADTQPSA